MRDIPHATACAPSPRRQAAAPMVARGGRECRTQWALGGTVAPPYPGGRGRERAQVCGCTGHSIPQGGARAAILRADPREPVGGHISRGGSRMSSRNPRLHSQRGQQKHRPSPQKHGASSDASLRLEEKRRPLDLASPRRRGTLRRVATDPHGRERALRARECYLCSYSWRRVLRQNRRGTCAAILE